MSEYLKAAAAAAGLSPEERQQMESLQKTLAVHRELSNLPASVAQQAYGSKTPDQQAALKNVAGNEDPVTKPNRGWLGTAWHYTGGALLQGLTEVSDLATRAYRTGAITVMEGTNPINAWNRANDKGDKVFNPGRIDKAISRFGQDRVNVAMRVAAGEKLSDIAVTGTEAERQIAALAGQNKDDLFQDALDATQAAKYSPGRQFANLITPEKLEGSGFFYRAVSGAIDAAFRVFADPLLIAGKAKRAVDISRYSLDVVLGGGKVDEVFARPQVQNFWNQYGAVLKEYKDAVTSGATDAAVAAKDKLRALAPEFGDPVIKSFIDINVPITDAATAKAFFHNTDQTVEMMKGQIGRKRVMMPTLADNVAGINSKYIPGTRAFRVNTVTTANRIFDMDKIGSRFMDDAYFGGAATDDGVAKAIIDGKETIITNVKAQYNAKKTARFSMAQVQYRIDRFKAKFSQVPFFEDDLFDVTAADGAEKVYRYARLVLPQGDSKLIAQAFENAEVGRKKEIFYGLQSTIADIRGLNVTKEGKVIADPLRLGPNKVFAATDAKTGYNPAALPDGEQVALILSDQSDFVTTLGIRDIDRAAARSGFVQHLAGLAHSNWVEKMTAGWSFLTLAGPRYAVRNATEDLLVHLAIGESPFGLTKARMLSTRLRTAKQVETGLTKFDKVAADPLGGVLRFVNKKESKAYGAQILAANGDVKQIREIVAGALNEGKLTRFYERTGLGKFTKADREALAEQIKFGDLDNALMDVVEGGKNAFTGLDYYTRAINFTRKNKVRTAELGYNLEKGKFGRAKGKTGYTQMAPLADEASQVAWIYRIGYYSNDKLGRLAVANLTDDGVLAKAKVLEWMNDPKNAKLVAGFRMEERGISNEEHAQRIVDAAKQLFVKKDGTLNQELLGKIRTVDEETGAYRISGSLGLDDLPKDIKDVPEYIVGPQLVPVSDSGNYASSFMEWGWDWLGEANARFSREPMVLSEMVKMRKEFKKTGFEDAFIKAHTKGLTDEKAIEKATLTARRKLAEIVEDRSRLQTLAYVDNPAVQSQLSFSIRNFARFYRATEDFYRRIYRVVRYNPESIVKASLTYEGVTHSGWVQYDDQGEPYFLYPGTQYVYKAVQAAMVALGVPAEFKVPFPVEFGAKLKMITPSLNPESAVPTLAGPLSGLSIKVISNVVGIFSPGAADTITRTTLGKYAEDQPMVSAFLPAHINRIYAALNKDERDGQYASAMRKAITYLEASGHGLQQKYETVNGEKVAVPFSAGELEAYRLKLKNTTMSILGLRVLYGFVAPASPTVQLKSEMADWVRDNGEASFKQVWYGMLDKYGDYDTAMTEWVKRYPDQMPFTISESERSTVAYFRYAQESGDFVDKNPDLFKNYPQGAAFLIPHKGGYSWDAYKTMTDMGLRQNKTVTDFLREAQTAADMQVYYDRKNEYEASLEKVGTDFERSALRAEFQNWATVFKAGRPLVQEELSQGGKKAIERMKALNDLEKMLSEKAAFAAAPDTAKKLKDMMNLYQGFKKTQDEFDNFGGSQFLSDMNKEETIIKMRELAAYNENTQSAYNVLFGRLLGD